MHRESSGDPLSYNDTDTNFHSGYPSKGLLQTIPTTFKSMAPAGYNTNIWDPLSNALASLNHIGDPNSYPGGAYARGGIVPGASSGKDTVPAWLSPGEAVISRQSGSETANKGYLGEAASWFGGQVMYPNDAKAMPPNMTGMGHVTVHAPRVEVRFYGDAAEFNGRVETMIDGRLVTVTDAINRKAGQG